MSGSNGASFKDKFRQARQERGRERSATSSNKGTLKRRRGDALPSEASPFAKKESKSEPSQPKERPEAAEGVLSKNEIDRILMPPPGPLRKEIEPPHPQLSPETPLLSNNASIKSPDKDQTEVNGVMGMSGGSSGASSRMPEDFFEVETKRASEELEKERTVQRTNAEYVRFQKELGASLEEMHDEEAQEEEESEQHRQERDAYEQQQRLKVIEDMKAQRQSHPSTPPATSKSLSTVRDASSSEDDDQDDAELQWRVKKE